MHEWFGLDKGAAPGMVSWKKGLRPEDLESTMQVIETAIQNKTPITIQYRMLSADGYL